MREATYATIKAQTVVKQKKRVYAMNDNRPAHDSMSLEEARSPICGRLTR